MLSRFQVFCLISIVFSISTVLSGCSSTPPVKSQAYAKLKNNRTYENEFPVVWKAIEETFRNYKVTDRDPKDVGELAMRKLTGRTLETDWIYGQSRDKYQEYQVNGFPRKTYLQTRFKYKVEAKKVIGGVHVTVKTDEQIERLNANGTPDGYDDADEVDSSRANEILEKIQQNILAAPPIQSQ